nr:uncharacterized protein LOC109169324 [Ipomoea trifida]
MVQKLAQITIKNHNVSYASTPPRPVMMCDLCGGEHNSGECFNDDTNSQSSMEHVDLVGYGRQQQSFQPQGAYNPNAPRNHPGFSWSNPNGAANPQSYGNRNPPPGFQGQQNFRGGQTQQFRPNQGFQPQAPPIQPRPPLPTLEAPPPPNWEAMMEMMVKSQLQSEERFRQVTERLDQLSAHNKMLENQIANQASTSSTKPDVGYEKSKEDVTVQDKEKDSSPYTIDSCVGETLGENNWVSNYPLQDNMGDTNEEEHMEEDTSGDDDPLTPPPMYEALSLEDHLASQKENIAPKLLNMAPKGKNPKRNRGESSRQPQAQHHAPQYEIFNTPGAHERYQACISKRPIKAERGIEIITPNAWNWGTSFLAQPSDAFDSIVREFYANAKDGVETHRCIVRGVAVDFSPAAINAYYGTTNHRGYDYYHRDLRSGNITQADLDTIARSFHQEAEWNIRNGVAVHMDYRFFFPLDRAITDFVRAKLIPNSHRGNVKRDLVFLTYCIKEHKTIDIGRFISRSISDIAQTEAKTRCFLGHPSLITELCRRAGVPIIENQEVRLPPQLYLSQHHIQTRYGQGHVPVPDPQDAENED